MIAKKNGPGPEKEGPTHVAFYIRVSSDKQARKQDGSLDTQLDLLKKFAEYKKSTGANWTVSERFVEGESEGKRRGKSAKDTNRPTFQKMLQVAKAQLIDVIAITRIDRISRSVVDFLLLVEDLSRYGVKVVSLRENIDLTTPTGKFQTILMIALAQHEREMISARVKEKVEWRAEHGFPIGPPPSGYVMKDKMYVIDEERAQHVRVMDALYLEHQSADAVVVKLRELGYRTPRGSIYTVPIVCRMLRSLTYAAKIDYEGSVYDAQWPAIRTPETHQRIQELMDANVRTRHSAMRKLAFPYLLQGLLHCEICEHAMTPMPGTGRNGKYYPYYSCANAQKSLGATCPRTSFPADVVDRALIEYLKKLQLDPEVIRKFAARANETATETGGKLQADLARVREQTAHDHGVAAPAPLLDLGFQGRQVAGRVFQLDGELACGRVAPG
jgi:site-specific DNA recombinase